MQPRVLVIDDAEVHQDLTRHVLEPACLVTSARTLAEAEAQLAKNPFDLILLDVELPDGDGFSFFTKLKAQPRTSGISVIFITAHTELENELMGFSLGAEDYIHKPVNPLCLKARVEARLRRISEQRDRDTELCKGNIKLSISTQKAILLDEGEERNLNLTPVEFKLLFQFLRFEDRVFSREQLLTAIWDNAEQVFERTVDMHVSKLRRKIVLTDFKISAVHGTGYRLNRHYAAAED